MNKKCSYLPLSTGSPVDFYCVPLVCVDGFLTIFSFGIRSLVPTLTSHQVHPVSVVFQREQFTRAVSPTLVRVALNTSTSLTD